MPEFVTARASKNKSAEKAKVHTAKKTSPRDNQRAVNDMSLDSPAGILGLQRTLGNQAVCSLVQAKLRVGAAGDRYEREADRIADAIINRKTGTEVEVQRFGAGAGGFEVDNDFQRSLSLSKGGGSPLPAALRREFEPKFGMKFNDVRVHNDARADQLSRSINASAFTHGKDIYFARGQYAPGTKAGKRLIAHELTHTIQQSGGIQRWWVKKGKGKEEDENITYGQLINKLGGYGDDFEDFLEPKTKEIAEIFNAFKMFCKKEWSLENLNCYLAIRDYEKSPSKEKALYIYYKYINEDAEVDINIDKSLREAFVKAFGIDVNAKYEDILQEDISREEIQKEKPKRKFKLKFFNFLKGRHKPGNSKPAQVSPEAQQAQISENAREALKELKTALKNNMFDTFYRFKTTKVKKFKEEMKKRAAPQEEQKEKRRIKFRGLWPFK